MDNKLNPILAVDFDGTLVEDKFPEIGKIRPVIFEAAKTAQKHGVKLILWTCRNGDRLKEAVEFCAENGLHFDAINENLDEVKVLYGGDTRKVFADEYWDDKGVNPTTTAQKSQFFSGTAKKLHMYGQDPELICEYCHSRVYRCDKFCSRCGYRLVEEEH